MNIFNFESSERQIEKADKGTQVYTYDVLKQKINQSDLKVIKRKPLQRITTHNMHLLKRKPMNKEDVFITTVIACNDFPHNDRKLNDKKAKEIDDKIFVFINNRS